MNQNTQESNTFAITAYDASAVEGTFCRCPRMYKYRYEYLREGAGLAFGRTFGNIYHKVLHAHYTQGIVHEDRIEELYWEQIPQSYDFSEEHRTVGYMKDLYGLYCSTYPTEPFTILTDANGIPLVERSFAVPLPGLDPPAVWAGKIDLPVVYPDGRLWVMDHKTSLIAGETFWSGFTMSLAQHGYCWAMEQLFQRPVAGYIINAIFTRKQTRTGKGMELMRTMYELRPGELAEWQFNTTGILRNLAEARRTAIYPMHPSACIGRYGACEYLPVCSTDASLREHVLMGDSYQTVTFTPLE